MNLKNLIIMLIFLIKLNMLSQNKTGDVKKFNSYIEFIVFLEEKKVPYEFTRIEEIEISGNLFFIDVNTNEIIQWSQVKDFVLLYKSIDEFLRFNPSVSNVDVLIQKYIISKTRNIFFEEKQMIKALSKDNTYYYKKIEGKLGVTNVDIETSPDLLNMKIQEYIKSGKNINDIFLPLLFFCGNKILNKYGGEWTISLKKYYFGMEYYMPQLLINKKKIDISSFVSKLINSKVVTDIDLKIVLKQIEPFVTGKIVTQDEDIAD